jgi:hypothetical protein
MPTSSLGRLHDKPVSSRLSDQPLQFFQPLIGRLRCDRFERRDTFFQNCSQMKKASPKRARLLGQSSPSQVRSINSLSRRWQFAQAEHRWG